MRCELSLQPNIQQAPPPDLVAGQQKMLRAQTPVPKLLALNPESQSWLQGS